ncbi:type-F conjugative transfer system mating-pair stabilization protein TraN [Vibrio crassostreae]|uniref:type-F conjugative transfer system mating-pair stabilization protein TraN n=2 Tax=Vibrio crassostreae TaxID=246167 RepID=UPI000637EDC9|nr:type-F conjugative transfer system mating-pair stabilization protein TraN [Vibrio crassostreae]TCL18207.1 conjugal transfer mating pair stabilization protein TraN [Vibrio crassostreae]TCN97911.1 conjugal transfer mating pair stabilization protein TraN [Vibrio crassostreae]TCT42901.1 conjugal transfer mating pair stabilization protein TraN [Vibrio crassostreae]TCT47813.1 conjugal transfer mating pair stabilization protein TraN [Vibrio crassostreae]CAK1958348.1 conjugal transfer mating pair s
MRIDLWAALTLSFLSTLALASEQQTFTESANWAKQTASQALAPHALPLNVDDYCKDATCRQEIRSPKESTLSDSEINAQKGTEFVTNGLAQDINTHFNKGRPDVKSDPAMRFALLGQENAYEITHGLSNAYVDCDSGSQCLIEHIPKQCHRPTNNNVPCTKVPVASVSTGEENYRCPSGWTQQGRDCQRPLPQCRYNNDNYVRQSGTRKGFSGSETTYFWDGKIVSPNQGYTLGDLKHTINLNWQWSAYWHKRYEICRPTTQTKKATLSCSNGFSLSGGNCIKNTMIWRTQCRLMNSCQVTRQQCIEGRATRTINGIPTTLNCWKYRIDHRCDRPNTCANLPKDCTTQTQHCSLKQNGVCIEQEVTKRCAEKTCRATDLQCGEHSFCLDGECYEGAPKLNSNFDKSVAALAGLAEAVKDIGDPPKIFTGKPMKCSKKLAGFNDCCKDSGWGQGLGAKCSEAEEALGEAKEKGLTLYVGQYCAKKVLGVCTRKKRSYCVYDNKLAKIIQEQGSLQQLGKRLGSAKNPTCAAITPEELGQINFEYIDFKEFYPEMRANTNLPNFDEIKKRLQSATGG